MVTTCHEGNPLENSSLLENLQQSKQVCDDLLGSGGCDHYNMLIQVDIVGKQGPPVHTASTTVLGLLHIKEYSPAPPEFLSSG